MENRHGEGLAQGPVNLKNLSLEEMERDLAPFELSPRQIRQLRARVLWGGLTDVGEVQSISKRQRAQLKAGTTIPSLTLVSSVESEVDHFRRFLFRTADGYLVEAVRIPLLAEKYSICISSQVGCALGCTFCATATLGFKRNLEAWEIVDQVMQIKAVSDRPITGALFMGQGEPFLNYDNVLKAADILRDPCGLRIRGQNITISTAGILPRIRQYTAEGHPYRLIVSLSAGTSATRQKIMPIERKYPLSELALAIKEYADARQSRATIAWVAMEGINTGQEEIDALRALLKDTPAIFNLIEVNDTALGFSPPAGDALKDFIDRLSLMGIPVVRRYTGGKDVEAACGMLAARQVAREASQSAAV